MQESICSILNLRIMPGEYQGFSLGAFGPFCSTLTLYSNVRSAMLDGILPNLSWKYAGKYLQHIELQNHAWKISEFFSLGAFGPFCSTFTLYSNVRSAMLDGILQNLDTCHRPKGPNYHQFPRYSCISLIFQYQRTICPFLSFCSVSTLL